MSARICVHNAVSIAVERKTFDKPTQGCRPFTTLDIIVIDSAGVESRIEVFCGAEPIRIVDPDAPAVPAPELEAA